MSTNPSTVTAGSLLDKIAQAEGDVQLGLVVGGTVISLITGTFKSIKTAISGASGTMDYTVVIQGQEAQLDADIAETVADIETANAELARMGYPQIPLPVDPAPAADATGTAEATRTAGTPAPGTVQPVGPQPEDPTAPAPVNPVPSADPSATVVPPPKPSGS